MREEDGNRDLSGYDDPSPYKSGFDTSAEEETAGDRYEERDAEARYEKKHAIARNDDEDDGRTIVNMNVEGMPWYIPKREGLPEGGSGPHYQMTPEEQRMYTLAALKSGLLIAAVFAVVFGLFIAFCDFIWFR